MAREENLTGPGNNPHPHAKKTGPWARGGRFAAQTHMVWPLLRVKCSPPQILEVSDGGSPRLVGKQGTSMSTATWGVSDTVPSDPLAYSRRTTYTDALSDSIMTNATVLIVDDEDLIRWSLRERLQTDGYDILEAGTGKAALEQFRDGVDLVLLDYRLPDTDGLSVLREMKKLDPDILVILLTSFVSVETAVEAMKLGAFHFANKPFNVDEVSATVARALETTRLRREVKQLRANEARPYSLRAIVGESDTM
jgi:FixJ family two-component response regulator